MSLVLRLLVVLSVLPKLQLAFPPLGYFHFSWPHLLVLLLKSSVAVVFDVSFKEPFYPILGYFVCICFIFLLKAINGLYLVVIALFFLLARSRFKKEKKKKKIPKVRRGQPGQIWRERASTPHLLVLEG